MHLSETGGLWRASPFTDKISGLNPAIGKMGPFAPKGEHDPSPTAALR